MMCKFDVTVPCTISSFRMKKFDKFLHFQSIKMNLIENSIIFHISSFSKCMLCRGVRVVVIFSGTETRE